MKSTNLCDGSWDRLTFDSFNTEFINVDSLFGDNITKENNLRSNELTLPKFNI